MAPQQKSSKSGALICNLLDSGLGEMWMYIQSSRAMQILKSLSLKRLTLPRQRSTKHLPRNFLGCAHRPKSHETIARSDLSQLPSRKPPGSFRKPNTLFMAVDTRPKKYETIYSLDLFSYLVYCSNDAWQENKTPTYKTIQNQGQSSFIYKVDNS